MKVLYAVVDDVELSAAEKDRLTSAGQACMRPGDCFDVQAIPFGPARYYESAVGLALCVPGLLELISQAHGEYDAFLIGCFGDPGLRAAREISSVPVIGGGESALTLSRLVSRRFGVVTIEDTDIPELRDCVELLGLGRYCVDINAIGLPFNELTTDTERTLSLLEECAAPLLAAGAESIVLGCMSFGFYPFSRALSRRIGVPVLDGVRAGIAAANALATIGATHSRRWVPLIDDEKPMRAFLKNFNDGREGNGNRGLHD